MIMTATYTSPAQGEFGAKAGQLLQVTGQAAYQKALVFQWASIRIMTLSALLVVGVALLVVGK
jgi:hypothetical protein